MIVHAYVNTRRGFTGDVVKADGDQVWGVETVGEMMRAGPTLKKFFQAYKYRFGERPLALTEWGILGESAPRWIEAMCKFEQ